MTLAKQPTNNETKEEIIKKNFIFFLKEIFETKSNKWIGKIDKISELITIGKVVKQLEEECIKYEITIIKSKTNTTPAINYCITVCKKKNEYYTTVTDVSTQITGYLYELYSNKDVTNNTNEICKANKPRKTRKTPPNICMERLKLRNRECEQSLPLEYIKQINELYNQYYDSLHEKMHLIDGTNNVNTVVESVLNVLKTYSL